MGIALVVGVLNMMPDIPDTGQEWPFHLSPIPYRPEDEQDWRRSIFSGIAFGPRLHPTVEEWKPVPEYESFYEVSNLGRVRSLYFDPPKILALHPDSNGYPFVGMNKGGKRTPKTVHRLVCRAFHGEPPEERQEAAHLDGIRTNCRADNLAWVDKAENHFHRRAHGTHFAGEKHPRAKLTESQAMEIKFGPPTKARIIAEKYGISTSTVYDIRKNRLWSHLTIANAGDK